MRYLVTGSSGHLGEALVRTLHEQGTAVTGVDTRSSPFTTVVGSIADPAIARTALEDVDIVLHTATLHKPHAATHTRQEFVETNVAGTVALLEAAVQARVSAFVLTSTTSTFGRALVPAPGAPAVWVTEDTVPRPRNIYGATKLAAEQIAEEVHHNEALPVVVLRTSRFFPEPDDRPELRARLGDDNLKANELLHRRVDIADVVDAHLLAGAHAPNLGFGRYIVSATTPFTPDHLHELTSDAEAAVTRAFPEAPSLYAQRGWSLPSHIDRVYVSARARAAFGWEPAYGFSRLLQALRADEDWRSPLARTIGIKGYHDGRFADGTYPLVGQQDPTA